MTLFGDKEPQWLEVASTKIDSNNHFNDEQETLNKVYAIKSDHSKRFIDDVWNDLKDKSLIQYESGLKLNNLLPGF